jgi:hypothetical protein
MASMDDALAQPLIREVRAWLDRHVVASAATGVTRTLRQWAAGRAVRDALRWGVSPEILADAATAPPLPFTPTAGPVLRRSTWGTVTFDECPQAPDGVSRWTPWQASALYWMNGRRDAGTIRRLVHAETGEPDAATFERYLQHLMDAGLAVPAERA